MKHRHSTTFAAMLLASVLVVAASADFASAQSAKQPQAARPPARRTEDFSERYGILSDKNIFIRNRPVTRRGNSRPNAPPRPEAMHVLTGITLQEGRHVAFVEDTGTHSTQRLVPGESVAGGKVVNVKFDALEFEMNGQRVEVRVGRNLLGDVYVPPAPVASTTSSDSIGTGTTTGPAAAGAAPAKGANAAPAPPPLPNAPNLSAEEKMKLRRQQQIGGGR